MRIWIWGTSGYYLRVRKGCLVEIRVASYPKLLRKELALVSVQFPPLRLNGQILWLGFVHPAPRITTDLCKLTKLGWHRALFEPDLFAAATAVASNRSVALFQLTASHPSEVHWEFILPAAQRRSGKKDVSAATSIFFFSASKVQSSILFHTRPTSRDRDRLRCKIGWSNFHFEKLKKKKN